MQSIFLARDQCQKHIYVTKSIFFSAFCHIHGTWVSKKLNEDIISTTLNACAKLGQVPKMAPACVVKSFEITQWSEHELYTLKVSFYLFETSPVFVCLLNIVEAQFLHFLLK